MKMLENVDLGVRAVLITALFGGVLSMLFSDQIAGITGFESEEILKGGFLSALASSPLGFLYMFAIRPHVLAALNNKK